MRCQSHMSYHCLGYMVANYYPFMPRARDEILVILSKDSLMHSLWLLEQTLSSHELLPSTLLPNLFLVRLDQVTPSGCLLDPTLQPSLAHWSACVLFLWGQPSTPYRGLTRYLTLPWKENASLIHT